MNKRQQRAAAGIVAFSSLCYMTGHAQTSQEIRAASALFEQYETVAYARADLSAGSDTNGPLHVDSVVNLKLPFEELIAAIHILGPTTAADLRNGYGSVLMGAKDFVPPKGIGAVRSRKCYIGVLEGRVQPNIEADFGNTSHELIGGRRVWTWSTRSSNETPSPTEYYAAQIANSYFVMTNNPQDFEQIVRAITSGESSKSAPTGVFGWETFSTHKYWMSRLLRRDGVASPIAAGIKELSPDLAALVFIADVDQRRGSLMVLSSDRAMKTVPSVFLDSESNRLQPLGSGIWQTTIPLTNDQAGFNTLFRVFYSFGFGAFL
jgi:hypothetical protein